MLARLVNGPADGLLLWVRGLRDTRPGRRGMVALIAVFECDDGGVVKRVPVEHPEYPDADLLNSAAGRWRYYYAVGEPVERVVEGEPPVPVDFVANV